MNLAQMKFFLKNRQNGLKQLAKAGAPMCTSDRLPSTMKVDAEKN